MVPLPGAVASPRGYGHAAAPGAGLPGTTGHRRAVRMRADGPPVSGHGVQSTTLSELYSQTSRLTWLPVATSSKASSAGVSNA